MSEEIISKNDKRLAYVIVGIMVALIVVATVGTIMVDNAFSKSYASEYSNGYENGKENGKDDRQDGNDRDSTCPNGSGLTYCAGYKIGYMVGWTAAGAIEN